MNKEPNFWEELDAQRSHNVPQSVCLNVPTMEQVIASMSTREQSSGALKYDSAKPMTDLLDPAALTGLAAVLTFGAKKYEAHNWRKGMKWSRLIAAMLRHLFAIMRGENIDPESGLPHIDHLGCCWMFLSNYMKTQTGTDDRHKA